MAPKTKTITLKRPMGSSSSKSKISKLRSPIGVTKDVKMEEDVPMLDLNPVESNESPPQEEVEDFSSVHAIDEDVDEDVSELLPPTTPKKRRFLCSECRERLAEPREKKRRKHSKTPANIAAFEKCQEVRRNKNRFNQLQKLYAALAVKQTLAELSNEEMEEKHKIAAEMIEVKKLVDEADEKRQQRQKQKKTE